MKRGKLEQERMLDPWSYISQGVSRCETTQGELSNGLTTESLELYFQLSCGCLHNSLSAIGGSCLWCQAEAIAEFEEAGLPFHPDQPYWMAAVDKTHSYRCSEQFCDRVTCHRHGGIGPDGNQYCLEHLEELSRDLKLAEKFGKAAPLFKSTKSIIKKLLGGE